MHRLRRAREWAAHRSMWLYYGAILGAAADAAWPGLPLTPAWLFGMIVILVFGEHGSPFCELCFKALPRHPRCAAKLPRYNRWLRGFHGISAHPHRPLLFLALYALAAMTIGMAAPLSWHYGWISVAYTAFLYSPMGYALKCSQVHARFTLHCPICHPGRGNDDDAAPDPTPDPVPSGTKELQPA